MDVPIAQMYDEALAEDAEKMRKVSGVLYSHQLHSNLEFMQIALVFMDAGSILLQALVQDLKHVKTPLPPMLLQLFPSQNLQNTSSGVPKTLTASITFLTIPSLPPITTMGKLLILWYQSKTS